MAGLQALVSRRVHELRGPGVTKLVRLANEHVRAQHSGPLSQSETAAVGRLERMHGVAPHGGTVGAGEAPPRLRSITAGRRGSSQRDHPCSTSVRATSPHSGQLGVARPDGRRCDHELPSPPDVKRSRQLGLSWASAPRLKQSSRRGRRFHPAGAQGRGERDDCSMSGRAVRRCELDVAARPVQSTKRLDYAPVSFAQSSKLAISGAMRRRSCVATTKKTPSI